MLNIKTAQGQGRLVLIFKNIVIKLPKNKFGLISNLTETIRYYKAIFNPELKNSICPIYFSLFGLIIIMPKVKTISEQQFNAIGEEDNIYKVIYKHYNNPIFMDIKPENFGYYKENIVKLDYGDNYTFNKALKDIGYRFV